ncbi:uncharacterized protein [Littorina saxatilis]|uniref:Uncharacterized protein n=1 Tax=Littorina saxatilis TaxID=31220 RepID=A0AAN9GPS6_9CAEN
MASPSLLTISCLVAMLCMEGLHASGVLGNCHKKCRAEEELKRLCKVERSCEQFLPDFGMFLECIAPCTQIGNNCFQRCAFKTDDIADTCLSRCGLGDVNGGAGPLTPGYASSNGVSTAEQDNSHSTLCYKSCYDGMLNDAMNRLYRKRP